MPDPNSRLVYSTDGGPVRPASSPSPSPAPSPSPSRGTAAAARRLDPHDGFVRIRREKKGRGGKTVTVVTGLDGAPADLDRWLRVLKAHCGAGGTREGDTLVIQGDHRERVQARLEADGLRVKQAGG